MPNMEISTELQAEDEVYEKAPLQFTADRLSELVRSAEADPNRQVTVHLRTMHKLYLAYIGVLEVYQSQTAGGILIDGKRYLCSLDLRDAIAPIVDEHRRNLAEREIDREIELMKAEAAARSSSEANPSAEEVAVDLLPKLH
jgi:hypothetical protein